MVESRLNVYPVLLAGGSGTRLWPVSRERYPKQLVKFTGEESLVQSTVKRLIPVLDKENIRVVCGDEHAHEIVRHMKEIGINADGKVIGEPCGMDILCELADNGLLSRRIIAVDYRSISSPDLCLGS